jgi:hypothetical protein
MLRRIVIVALAATSLVGAASIPISAFAAQHGGGGHGGGGFGHGGFGGGGFTGRGVARSFAAPGVAAPHAFAGRGFVGHGFEPGFRGHRFARFGAPAIGLGLGLGLGAYGYDDDACYAWTPYYGYRWVCGYDY